MSDAKKPTYAPPLMRWTQDLHKLYVVLESNCKEPTVKATFTESTLAFTCTGQAGNKYDLVLDLREDIQPAQSECRKVQNEVVCTMQKTLPHKFDQLLFDPKDEMNKFLRKDWSIQVREDDEEEPDEVRSQSSLTEEEYNAVINDNELVFVYPFLPWCTRCGKTTDWFIDANKYLVKVFGKTTTPPFLKINLVESRWARKRFATNCTDSDSCGFFIVRAADDGEVFVSQDYADEAELLSLYSLFRLPAIYDAPDDEYVRPSNATVILSGPISAEQRATIWQPMAKYFRENFPGQVSFNVMKGHASATSLTAAVNLVEFKKDIMTHMDEFKAFVLSKAFKFPAFHYGTSAYYTAMRKVFPILSSYGVTFAHVFYSKKLLPEPKQVQAKLGKAVTDFLPEGQKAMILWIGVDLDEHRWFFEEFGFPASALADILTDGQVKVALAKKPETTAYKYPFMPEVSGWTGPKDLESFLSSWLENGPTTLLGVKSETPVPWKGPGHLAKLTGIEAAALSTKPITDPLLVFLVDSRRPPNEVDDSKGLGLSLPGKAAEALGEAQFPTFKVAKMDIYRNWHEPREWEDLAGDETPKDIVFPGVLLLLPNGQNAPKRYMFPRSQPPLLENLFPWVKELLPDSLSVPGDWEKLTSMLKQTKSDKKSKYQKWLAEVDSAEEVPIQKAGDRTIIKHILKQGSGDVPPAGSTVQMQYTGYILENGHIFDSSASRATQKAFEFVLGDGQVLPCLDRAVTTMKAGEVAYVTCHPEVAYGKAGNPPWIPANAVLRFHVELVSFNQDEL